MNANVIVLQGDCLDVLRSMPSGLQVDAIVTDPPYGLSREPDVAAVMKHWLAGDDYIHRGGGFMGKSWDSFVPGPAIWRECYARLKPGGHLLAFGGTRTYDLLVLAIRLAGFEIRDSIHWIYGNGFPKGKSQLKPAHEPIVVVRKPLSGTVTANVLQHGTGAINVDGCRVAPSGDREPNARNSKGWNGSQGRWPANVLLDEDAAAELDQQTTNMRAAKRSAGGSAGRAPADGGVYANGKGVGGGRLINRDDDGGASRFFPVFRYATKAPTKERPSYVNEGGRKIAHPTCKPLELMRWLVRLVTPPGGIVLDPFAGSGATAEACLLEGFRSVMIEREFAYLPLIQQRIAGSVTQRIS